MEMEGHRRVIPKYIREKCGSIYQRSMLVFCDTLCIATFICLQIREDGNAQVYKHRRKSFDGSKMQ